MHKINKADVKKIDAIILIVCLIGFLISGIIFWMTYTGTLTRLNEEPVGLIVFKKRTAQRRFIDRVVWDRLRQTSPVYNGDTIRTIEFSEAIVNFGDELSYLTLNEKTMIQIFYSDREGGRIKFSEGQLTVKTGLRNIVVMSRDSEIVIDGQVRLNSNEKGFDIFVLEGQAYFNRERLESGDFIALDANGEQNLLPSIAMTTFGSSSRMMGRAGTTTDVVFSWKEFNFTDDTHVIVEAALDGDFSRLVSRGIVTGATSTTLNLESGNYWWRAYPVRSGNNNPINDIYPYGLLEIIPVSSAELVSPADVEQIAVQPQAGPAPARTPRPPASPQQGSAARSPERQRSWSSFIDERSAVTLEFSVNNDGVCTVIAGGRANRLNAGLASINYQHWVNQGKRYVYEFEAWAEAGVRSLTVINPSNYESRQLISSERRSFTVTSQIMPQAAQVNLRFLFGDLTGTYYLRIISITEED